MKTPFLLLAIFFVILIGSQNAEACSCRRSNPPCAGLRDKAIVFSAEVLDVKNEDSGKSVTVRVLEKFTNVQAEELIVRTGSGGGDCGFNFEKGEKYLIYASEYNGQIGTSICSRTRLLSTAKGDINILRALKSKQKIKPQLFGNTVLIDKANEYSSTALSKIQIIARNESGKTFITETDPDGNYLIADLPNGKYVIQAVYKTDVVKEEEIEIKPKPDEQCAEKNFYYYKGGRITGKVVDENGNPIGGLRVIAMQLKFSEGKEWDWTSHEGYTNKKGRYEIESLPNAKYYLGFNFFEPLKKEFPYPPTFYQNAKTKQQAARITVSDESNFTSYDFVVKTKLPPRLITGIVTRLDGKPANGAKIEIKEEGTTWRMDSADISENGAFSLTAFDGQSYYLYVYDNSADWGMNHEAKKIYVQKNGKVEKMQIVLPIYGKIEAVVTDETGKTIEEATLFLQCAKANGLSEQSINGWKGEFSFPLFEGCKYKIYAKITYGRFKGLQSEKIEISKDGIGKPIKISLKTNK